MSYRAFDPTLGQLAELLGEHFTVYNYDRRGRGESTDASDAASFVKEREIEDVQALIEDAGGKAMLFGVSSGGGVALETAAVTPGVTKVVVYEVPLIVDDSRSPVLDYEGHSKKLVAEGKLDELMNEYIPHVFGMLEQSDDTEQEQAQSAPEQPAEAQDQDDQGQAMMEAMYAVLPTIPHDAAFVGRFMTGKPLSAADWAKVKVPVLVTDGGASPAWLHNAAEALGKALPVATRHTFEGQTHMFDPEVLAPVISDFFKK